MLPSFEHNFKTSNPCPGETWIECLFCYKSFKPQTIFKDKIEVEILSDLFSTFSKHMKWESPNEQQFDFRKEQFPFCSSCSNNLVRVFKLDEQIQNLISDVISTIVYSQSQVASKKTGDEASGKLQFYRRQTIVQHQPTFVPKPVDCAEPTVSEKEPYCTDSPEHQHTLEDKVLVSTIPSKSSCRRSAGKKTVRFEDRVQRLGQSKFLYDNKYLFTSSLNHCQCLGCDEFYLTKLDLLRHWETAPCFSSEQPIEIVETFPTHDETVPTSSSAQESNAFQRDEISNQKLNNNGQKKKQKEGLRPFACTICGASFNSKYALQRHMLLLHTDENCKAFVCQICSRKFATNSLLKFHVHGHRATPCPICGKTYPLNSMYGHKKKQHPNVVSSTSARTQLGQKISVQKVGSQSSVTKQGLSKHLKRGGNAAESSSDCSAKNPNKNSSQKVKLQRDDGRPSFLCTQCDVSFNRKDSLQRHNFSLHVDESCKTFVCQICSRKFAKESLLKGHVLGHRKTPCPICGKVYQLKNLSWHMKRHKSSSFTTAANENLPQKGYKCKLCHLTIPTKRGLIQHLKCCRTRPASFTNTNCGSAQIKKLSVSQRIGCQFCSKIFCSKSSLHIHIVNCHTPEQDKAFQCRVCGKKYGMISLLKAHFRIHERIECDICNEIFAVNYIYAHKYIRHKSVECTVCYKNFKVDSIQEHIKWHKDQDPKGRTPASRDPRVRRQQPARRLRLQHQDF